MKKNVIVIIIVLFLWFVIGYYTNKQNTSPENTEISGIQNNNNQNTNATDTKIIEIETPWFEVHGDFIKIDYLKFINNLESTYYLDKIKQAEEKQRQQYLSDNFSLLEPEFILQIKNINGNDFDFISQISSQFRIIGYIFKFDSYNDQDHHIFEQINFSNDITSIDLYFNTQLLWENTLMKTLSKIKELNTNIIGHFDISWNKPFLDSYIMSKKEFEIAQSIPTTILSIRTRYDENTISLDYLENFAKNTSIWELTLFRKISKFNWKITNY